MFVPGGIWHAVINLDDTIAVTQNVMTHNCFDKVWRASRCERRKFAQMFLQKLKRQVTLLSLRTHSFTRGPYPWISKTIMRWDKNTANSKSRCHLRHLRLLHPHHPLTAHQKKRKLPVSIERMREIELRWREEGRWADLSPTAEAETNIEAHTHSL